MASLEEVINFYKDPQNLDIHKEIYTAFESNAKKFNKGIFVKHFYNTLGFGELAFSWSWYLIVKDMPDNFKFLEIGVYKGRVLSLIQLISNLVNKQVNIFGITPLNTSTDKYSKYDNVDYLAEIKKSFSTSNLSFDNTTIIEGLSQDEKTLNEARKYEQYDIIFIDGCHDYEIVCLDIKNYSKMLRPGGYLILDDSSSLLKGAYGKFLGHNDVGKAVQDIIDNDSNFVHLYAVGHNRVWKKQDLL